MSLELSEDVTLANEESARHHDTTGGKQHLFLSNGREIQREQYRIQAAVGDTGHNKRWRGRMPTCSVINRLVSVSETRSLSGTVLLLQSCSRLPVWSIK